MKSSQRKAMWAKRNRLRKPISYYEKRGYITDDAFLEEYKKEIKPTDGKFERRARKTYVVWGTNPISKQYGGVYVQGKFKAKTRANKLSKKLGYKFNVRKYQ